MNRIQIACATVLVSGPCALAQPVFFDDFDGDQLGPEWGFFSECGAMEYTVADSLFQVTRIYKVQPCEPTDVTVGVGFEKQLDFDMTAIMGWDEGTAQGFRMNAPKAGGLFIGAIGYGVWPGKPAVIGATVIGDSQKYVEIPAPPPGLYEFRLTRSDGWIRAYFEGQLLVEVPTKNFVYPLVGSTFTFGGPDSDEFSTLYIDRVTVTPGPGTLAIFMIVSTAIHRRRRTHARVLRTADDPVAAEHRARGSA